MALEDIIRILFLVGIVILYLLSNFFRGRNKSEKDKVKPAEQRVLEKKNPTEDKEESSTRDFLREVLGLPSMEPEKPQPVSTEKPRVRPARKTDQKGVLEAASRHVPPQKEIEDDSPIYIVPISLSGEEKSLEEKLRFSDDPVLQGIIMAELLSPPKALRE